MYKMTVLFRKPEETERFEDQWTHLFLPFAEKMPGIERIMVSNILGEPDGTSDYYRMHEFYFTDRQALDQALTSEMGVRAGNVLMTFASEIATILFSEVFEESRDYNETSVDASSQGK